MVTEGALILDMLVEDAMCFGSWIRESWIRATFSIATGHDTFDGKSGALTFCEHFATDTNELGGSSSGSDEQKDILFVKVFSWELRNSGCIPQRWVEWGWDNCGGE